MSGKQSQVYLRVQNVLDHKYEWNTKSEKLYVTCPSCLKKVKIEDEN